MQSQLELEPIGLEHKDGAPIIIAGPCAAESEEQVLETAKQLAALGCDVFRAGVWKPRTKPGGFEGYGEDALTWMDAAKRETGLRMTTEVATPEHIKAAFRHDIDALWIGARTTANPFAVQELADALRGCDIPVFVKNPVSPDLELWIGAMERLNMAGVKRLAAVHRGFSMYGEHIYRNAPIWKIPIELHRRFPNLPIICDPSHMGGKQSLIAPLCQTAIEMCDDGLMIEVHCDPAHALSDAKQQITPSQLKVILSSLELRNGKPTDYNLDMSRSQINWIDEEIVRLLANRMDVCHDVAKYKAQNKMPVLQPQRYDELLQKWMQWGKQYGLSRTFINRLFVIVHEQSVKEQLQIINSSE